MRKKFAFLSRCGDLLRISASLPSFESFSMSMDASGNLSFTGLFALYAFNENEVEIRFHNRNIRLLGDELTVSVLSEYNVSVSGFIKSILISDVQQSKTGTKKGNNDDYWHGT